MNDLILIQRSNLPALVAAAGERASRFLEFFAANIRNPHTRRAYYRAAEEFLRDDPKGPLFRTIGRGTGKLTRTVLPQANAYAMIGRRAAAAGIATKLGNHSFRATGITAYLRNGGTLEKAAAMANHASTRTTQRVLFLMTANPAIWRSPVSAGSAQLYSIYPICLFTIGSRSAEPGLSSQPLWGK